MYRRLSLTFVMIFLLAGCVFAQSDQYSDKSNAQVSAYTDRKTYVRGEEAKITLVNNAEESIYSIAASSMTPTFGIDRIEEKQSDGSWKSFAITCYWPECDQDFDFPNEIKPGASVSFKWNPVIHIAGAGVKDELPKPGIYRIVIIYGIRKSADIKTWEGFEARTNEFTIK